MSEKRHKKVRQSERLNRRMTSEQYDEKWLKDTNIGRLDEYINNQSPIRFYCKNEGCEEIWLISPDAMNKRLNNCEDKMCCCYRCKLKRYYEEQSKITHKVCTGPCERDLPLDEFHDQEGGPCGKRSHCKKCVNEASLDYNERHEEEKKEWDRIWRENNPEKCRQYAKDWKMNNPEKVQEWWDKNPDYMDDYRRDNEEHIRELNKKWRENHPDQVRETRRNWTDKNRDKINKRKRDRYHNDPLYRLIHNLRAGLNSALDGNTKTHSVLDYLCMDVEIFKTLSERKFEEGWTWDVVEMDHYIPVDEFDHSIEEEIQKCWHWTNLRPMFWLDNLMKWAFRPTDYLDGTRKWYGQEKGWITIPKKNKK